MRATGLHVTRLHESQQLYIWCMKDSYLAWWGCCLIRACPFVYRRLAYQPAAKDSGRRSRKRSRNASSRVQLQPHGATATAAAATTGWLQLQATDGVDDPDAVSERVGDAVEPVGEAVAGDESEGVHVALDVGLGQLVRLPLIDVVAVIAGDAVDVREALNDGSVGIGVAGAEVVLEGLHEL